MFQKYNFFILLVLFDQIFNYTSVACMDNAHQILYLISKVLTRILSYDLITVSGNHCFASEATHR